MKFAAALISQFSRGKSDDEDTFDTRLRAIAAPGALMLRRQPDLPSLFRTRSA